MDNKQSEVLVGKVEFDTELPTEVHSRMNKWSWLRDIVANDIKPVPKGSQRGWAKIPLVSKDEAIRGQQSILAFVREQLSDTSWKLQTAILPGENDSFNLMLRKVLE